MWKYYVVNALLQLRGLYVWSRVRQSEFLPAGMQQEESKINNDNLRSDGFNTLIWIVNLSCGICQVYLKRSKVSQALKSFCFMSLFVGMGYKASISFQNKFHKLTAYVRSGEFLYCMRLLPTTKFSKNEVNCFSSSLKC